MVERKIISFQIDEESNSKKAKCLSCLRTNALTLATVAGVVIGAILGIILKQSIGTFSSRQIMYVNFIGDLFLRMLKALILPLIISSLISAIASLDLSLSKRIAAKTITYYLTTTFLAVILGIVLVITIQPGKGHSAESRNGDGHEGTKRNVTTVDTLLDLIKSMFPPNLVEACTEQTRTVLKPPKNAPFEKDLYKWDVGEESVKSTNILGLVVISCIIGIALAQLKEEAQALTNFFKSLTVTTMKITTWVIWLSPIGIMFLVASKILAMDNIGAVMNQMGWYLTTVIIGLFIHGLIFLPLMYFLLTRKSPITYVANMSQAIATAFGTASSSATLPVTIKCLEENSGIDPRVTRFALPIGATINMDGTALYEAVAAIFIAQVRQVEMTIGTLIAVSITATAASIGAAGIPHAGLVTLVMVLDTVGLPAEDVALILAVDWILDRLRTAINIMGDAFGAGIVNHRSQKELEEIPQD